MPNSASLTVTTVPTAEIYSFSLDETPPSKKNSYEIHFSQSFWRAIAPIVAAFKGARYWIAPSKKVKEFENLVAWTAKAKLPSFPGAVSVRVECYGRAGRDSDNILGALFDGLQKSGRISNDSQIVHHEVVWKGKGKGCTVSVLSLEGSK